MTKTLSQNMNCVGAESPMQFETITNKYIFVCDTFLFFSNVPQA